MLPHALRRMSSRSAATAAKRTAAISQHLMAASTSAGPASFESNAGMRRYILNREAKLNALNTDMINLLQPKLEEWSRSDLCQVVVGSGKGRGFCAGGDVASVVQAAAEESTRSEAIEFFKKEFELDYALATLPKPYVTIMDGITMGGGVGLCAGAPFRIATENTKFAMPETKIGYSPDVGATYFLPRLDGQLGAYLALTGNTISGRDVFELGLATHYVPSRRIPSLLDRLASLEAVTLDRINQTIEELCPERSDEPPNRLVGPARALIDSAFGYDKVEDIVEELELHAEKAPRELASLSKDILDTLHQRSPTSLKVALRAVRKGASLSLLQCLRMELGIAAAFCSGASPDFITGVTHLLIAKQGGRPAWSPDALQDISDQQVEDKFFSKQKSPYLQELPELSIPDFLDRTTERHPGRFALPSEEEIEKAVVGDHETSGDMAVTLDELVENFATLRPGKVGVSEKILEVVQRRCRVSDDGYLEWVHRN
ncbi:3-hydroxyisobutyryl-CoA hydrolase [Punctularia strigosozonata HHB-11173 SS5]|uniref:3-hydroxyisobutyryl-CoA hydrolase n=1 Tax=Punctularia strigosozonata (strain HHB-11173) TaxID=741275 RepID=UPI0004416425|nr:3-hydroxyisobutyryl-CoA hydrolase [Punctularia strigosozonata HHB-11173 SS5]EIN07093.1 3-hydroxyisobutyryl-CoA hydrolase [Punctularia strigosozonata HHB-11173 SS5]